MLRDGSVSSLGAGVSLCFLNLGAYLVLRTVLGTSVSADWHYQYLITRKQCTNEV